ncbi:DRC2 protein, partial [Leptocoma aspasia]|nr:DRC2 protein [Leptocoma aspasia]
APRAAEAELLLLQSQALAEEEAAKAKRELLTRFLQEKLSREEQSSKWGLHKVRTLWRLAQRKTKDQELRQDIEILSQTFTRVMDCKDGAIEVAAGPAGRGRCQGTHMTRPNTPQALVRELNEAEEQQNRALRSHLHLTDQLLHLQRCRLGYLEEGFSAQVAALKAEFEAERCGISGGEGEWGSSGTRELSWNGVGLSLAPQGPPQCLCQGGN